MRKRLFLNENIILIIIIANSITILFGAFNNLPANQQKLITGFDNIITIIFIIEMIVKLSEYKFKGYFSSNWNRLDFILVVLSIPALFSWIFHFPISNLSFFLIFRVLRVFKSFRFLKFVPGITELIKGVQRALKTSVVIIFGFCIYIFIIGIISTYLYQNIAPEYFSNPLISFFSVFKIFTVGGWYEIVELALANTEGIITFFSKLYFVFILVTGGIFGLSLVNSIFVEAMMSDNTDDISQKIDNLEKKLDDYIKSEK